MIYILDAYNVIHKIQSLDRALSRDLRSAREALIKLCGQLAASRGDITKIILVFDGKSEFNNLCHSTLPKIRLVFSETGEDADERIISVLEELPDRTEKCVVSDDNFVRNQARAHKTRSLSVADFDSMTRRTSRTPGPRSGAAEKSRLSSKQADEITAAYKKALGLA